MKSILKKIATLALAATLSISALTLPAAAAWKTTENGKQWVNTDGSIAKSKWLKMKNGARYYIKSNGLAATGLLNLSEKVDGVKVKNTYYFDKNGKMQTGWQYVNKKYYYFDKETGRAYKNSTKKIGDYSYTFDGNGNWDKKVLKNGKDVTSKVDIAKLTGITAAKPATVTIAGQEYKTDAQYLILTQEGLTDEDLEPLKYFTKLKGLDIVPGAMVENVYGVCNGDANYEYVNTKCLGKQQGATLYQYEATAVVRDTSIEITNLDFCKYMPKLEQMMISYAPKLTDLTGLQNHTKLVNLYFFNCTALKDLHALDDIAFTGASMNSGVSVVFTDNVKYAFTDYYFGERLSSICDGFMVEPAKSRVVGPNWRRLETTDDFKLYFGALKSYMKPVKRVGYVYDELKYNIGM